MRMSNCRRHSKVDAKTGGDDHALGVRSHAVPLSPSKLRYGQPNVDVVKSNSTTKPLEQYHS